MRYVLDALYCVAGLMLLPWLALRRIRNRRVTELRTKLLGPTISPPVPGQKRVWFHGVSLGEIQLLSKLVAGFRERHPDWECVISSTTEAGLTEAHARFADLTVIPWPFDLSATVRRYFDQVQPDLIVLAEGEIWPNFLAEARSRSIPVVVVNARMSPRSFARYQRVRPLAGPVILDRVTKWAVQSDEYAAHLRELGVPPERLGVTGSIKYDGARGVRSEQAGGLPEVERFRELFHINRTDRVWVAGSTHPPEEKVVLETFRWLRVRFPSLRLIMVPRRPDRFDEVANLLDRMHFDFVRRRDVREPLRHKPAVVLVDSTGELGHIWGLADIAFVGGSLDGKRGGQSMIEPASYGAAVVFGPHVWNFRDPASRLREASGAIQIRHSGELRGVVRHLLEDPIGRQRLGEAARQLVASQQGATASTLDLIDAVLGEQQVPLLVRRAG